VPNATLGASLLLYALVHVFDWTVPAWPSNVWFFNPLAWQVLIVLGAWWVIEGKRFWPWVCSRTAFILAVLYLVVSLTIALSCSIKPLEPLIPQALAKLLYPLDKSNLDPLRLLHFLALAIFAVWLVPRDWRGLTTPVMRVRSAVARTRYQFIASAFYWRSPATRRWLTSRMGLRCSWRSASLAP
jgi:hypothetical protein